MKKYVRPLLDGLLALPLNSYTWTHGEARLSEQQRQTLVNWAQTNMDSLHAQYPADSLVLKRK
ncbi:MAG: heme-binding domain-containing protein [Saprospiraceae bacterium]|nr:heme-binding domain-containing protein [Saprospiraceae bacterium]